MQQEFVIHLFLLDILLTFSSPAKEFQSSIHVLPLLQGVSITEGLERERGLPKLLSTNFSYSANSNLTESPLLSVAYSLFSIFVSK